MLLETKNRIINNAVLCRDSLRKTHGDMLAHVNKFIADIESPGTGADKWNQFTDLRGGEWAMLQRVEDAFQKWLRP